MSLESNENPYEKLLGKKLPEAELMKMERNLCDFMTLLIEIDTDQNFKD